MTTFAHSEPNLFERILMLKRSMVFASVATEDLRVVANELTEEHYLAGERVFDRNEQGDHMYIIESGKIGISLNGDSKTSQFVATLTSGECFGEMGMLDDQPRSASAHVLEDTQLLVLEKSRLKALIVRYPELSLGILRSLSLRLRQVNIRLNT